MSTNSGNNTEVAGECWRLEEAPPWALSIYALLVAAIIIVTVVGNGLVVLLVLRYKRLRCRSVVISLSVSAADVLFALTFHLPIFISTVARGWQFADPGCRAFSYLGVDFLLTRWLIMGVLSVDRFCSVRFPFSYKKFSKCLLPSLTAAAWLLPVVLIAPSVGGLFDYSFRTNIATCLPDCHASNDLRNFCRLHFVGIFSTSFIFGGIVPIVLYTWLYRRARKLRPASLTLGVVSVRVASGLVVRQPMAQLGDTSRDVRALFTFIIIFVTLLVTGLPAYVLQIVRATTKPAVICSIPILVTFLLYALLLSSTALDPIVIMRDRDFRQCLRNFFCRGHLVSNVSDAGFPISDAAQSSNFGGGRVLSPQDMEEQCSGQRHSAPGRSVSPSTSGILSQTPPQEQAFRSGEDYETAEL